MHLRLPIVCGLVVLAAGAAVVREIGRPRAATAAFVPVVAARPPSPDAGQGAPRAAGGHARPQRRVVVYVAGDVTRPGLYALATTARANDAIAAAGGARPDADLVATNLAAPLADGDEIAVYVRGTAPTTRARRGAGATHRASSRAHGRGPNRSHRKRPAAGSASGDASIGPDEPLDLNGADATELATLPGIGPGLAERIVIVRDTSGPFASLDDLLDVGGMTVAKVDALAPYVTLR